MIWKIEDGFLGRYKFSAMVGGCKETAFYLKEDRVAMIVKFEDINKLNIFDSPIKGLEKIKSDLEYHLSLVNGELKRLNKVE